MKETRNSLIVMLMMIGALSSIAQTDSSKLQSNYDYFKFSEYPRRFVVKTGVFDGYASDFRDLLPAYVSAEYKILPYISHEIMWILPQNGFFGIENQIRFYPGKTTQNSNAVNNFHGIYIGAAVVARQIPFGSKDHAGSISDNVSWSYEVRFGHQSRILNWGIADIFTNLGYFRQGSLSGVQLGLGTRLGLAYGKNYGMVKSTAADLPQYSIEQRLWLSIDLPYLVWRNGEEVSSELAVANFVLAKTGFTAEYELFNNFSILANISATYSFRSYHPESNFATENLRLLSSRGFVVNFRMAGRKYFNRNKRLKKGELIPLLTGTYVETGLGSITYGRNSGESIFEGMKQNVSWTYLYSRWNPSLRLGRKERLGNLSMDLSAGSSYVWNHGLTYNVGLNIGWIVNR